MQDICIVDYIKWWSEDGGCVTVDEGGFSASVDIWEWKVMPTPDDRALDLFFVTDGMDLLHMKKKQVEVCKKIEYSMQLNASRIEYSMQPASANVFEAHKHNSTPTMLIKIRHSGWRLQQHVSPIYSIAIYVVFVLMEFKLGFRIGHFQHWGWTSLVLWRSFLLKVYNSNGQSWTSNNHQRCEFWEDDHEPRWHFWNSKGV